MLKIPPDRIGHGTFLHPSRGGSEEILDILKKNRVPFGESRDAVLDYTEVVFEQMSSSKKFATCFKYVSISVSSVAKRILRNYSF